MALSLKDLAGVPERMGDLDTESDRAVALIVAAFLGESLRRAIEVRLVHKPGVLLEKFFENHGAPASTFSARILSAHMMGIFGPDTYADLERIRKIRNLFAHSGHEVNFQTPAVAAITNALTAISRHFAPEEAIRRALTTHLGVDTRKLFQWTSVLYVTSIDRDANTWPEKSPFRPDLRLT